MPDPQPFLEIAEIQRLIADEEKVSQAFVTKALADKKINSNQHEKCVRKINSAFDKLCNDLIQICKPKRR